MPPDTSLQRRRYLFAFASAGAVGVAGCLGSGDDTEGGNDDTAGDSNDGGSDSSSANSDRDNNQGGSEKNDDVPEDIGWTVADPGEPLYTDDSNWRLIGHDTGNSFRNPHAAGPTSDPTVQWTFDTNVHGNLDLVHQPAIVDGTVYTRELLTPALGSESELQSALVAIDLATGEPERRFEVEGLIRRPTVVDDTVYLSVFSEGGISRPRESLRAYDLHSGELHWETEGVFTTLAVYPVGDRLVVTDTSPAFDPAISDWTPEMRVFDATTGERQWEYSSGSGQQTDYWTRFGLPTVTETVAHFPETSDPRHLQSGEKAGQFPIPARGPVTDGRLFDIDHGDTDHETGVYDWQSLDRAWTKDHPTSGVRSTVVDGTVVTPAPEDGKSAAQHTILGIDAKTGETLWQASPTFDDREFWRVPFPAAGSDLVYCPVTGGAFAIDPEDGSVVWKLDATGEESTLSAGCALAKDILLVVGYQPNIEGGSTLYAIS